MRQQVELVWGPLQELGLVVLFVLLCFYFFVVCFWIGAKTSKSA
jgi:hypothetical protein